MSELQRINDEGSDEEDEPRIDMSKMDKEEDRERDRSWAHYNRHVLREHGRRVDTMPFLRNHDVSSRSNNVYFFKKNEKQRLHRRRAMGWTAVSGLTMI